MKKILTLFCFVSLTITVGAQCSSLDDAIYNYEEYINGDGTTERSKYQKVYLVATEICACKDSNYDDVDIALFILSKVKSVAKTFEFDENQLSEAILYCRTRHAFLYSNNFGTNSALISSEFMMTLEYYEGNPTTDIRQMALDYEKSLLNHSENPELDIKKFQVLNKKMKERLINISTDINH